jgi:N-acetylglucosamine kinase-like BadF-type ATPase
MQAFSQMSDGRLPAGPLLGMIRTCLQPDTDLDAIAITMVRWQADRRRVAELSTVVAEAADRGDGQARAILSEAATHLVSLVDTARLLLGFAEGETVPVSRSGGVFSAARVRDEFDRLLTGARRNYDFRQPLHPPVVGAALYAAKLAGIPLGPEALARLGDQTAPQRSGS